MLDDLRPWDGGISLTELIQRTRDQQLWREMMLDDLRPWQRRTSLTELIQRTGHCGGSWTPIAFGKEHDNADDPMCSYLSSREAYKIRGFTAVN